MNKYKIDNDEIFKIKKTITNPENKLVALAGIKILEISERKVELQMPLTEFHLNHIGTAYAISIIMFMEVGGASLLRATYGLTHFEVIIKKINVSFINPANSDLFFKMELSANDAEKLIKPIEDRKRGNLPLKIVITNINVEIVAEADFIFYLLQK